MLEIYRTWLHDKAWHEDSSQLELLQIMDACKTHLESRNTKSGVLAILNKLRKVSGAKDTLPQKGLYIWGDVGRGKTMLMDLFYNNLQITRKYRLHFHQFMADVHKKLQLVRNMAKSNKASSQDQLLQIVTQMAADFKVLCLDELQINNIADAMLVGRIFSIFLEKGVFVVFTSNRPPEDLFKDDLQYARLLPFINLINQQMLVYNLNNYRDYRLEKIAGFAEVYHHPLDAKAAAFIGNAKQELSGHSKWHEQEIVIAPNRTLTALHTYGRIAHFTFGELCNTPLGAEDYMALCHHFNTIILTDIPQMGAEDYNQALRFITLIDCLYEHKTKLICTAATPPEQLYLGTRNRFEFARTSSRLLEMQSQDYLVMPLGEAA